MLLAPAGITFAAARHANRKSTESPATHPADTPQTPPATPPPSRHTHAHPDAESPTATPHNQAKSQNPRSWNGAASLRCQLDVSRNPRKRFSKSRVVSASAESVRDLRRISESRFGIGPPLSLCPLLATSTHPPGRPSGDRPPADRKTRANSRCARGQSNQCIARPTAIRSTDASGSVVASALPCTTSSAGCCAANSRQASSISPFGSTATTRCPASRKISASIPVPAPTSATTASRGRAPCSRRNPRMPRGKRGR